MSRFFYEWQLVSYPKNKYWEENEVEYFYDLEELSEMLTRINQETKNMEHIIRLTCFEEDEGRVDDYYIQDNELMKYGDNGRKCPIRYIRELDKFPYLKVIGEAKKYHSL